MYKSKLKIGEIYNWLKNNLSVVVIVVEIMVVVVTNYDHQNWESEDKVIQWDIKSYYSYLPAVFVHNDVTLSFMKGNSELYHKTWPVKLDNGNWLIVTSCGLSILYTPFFLFAYLYASLTEYPADGYSEP